MFVADADGSNLRQITNDPASDRGVRWSPDGTRILYYSAKPGELMKIFTMAPDGSDQRLVSNETPAGSGSWTYPQWSPLGDRISAYTPGAGGYLFAPAGSGGLRATAMGRVGSAAFLPGVWLRDGRRIVGVLEGSGEVVIYDLEQRTYTKTGIMGVPNQGAIGLLPDDHRFVTVRSGSLAVVDLESKSVSVIFDPPNGQAASQPRLSSDGRRLFFLHSAFEADIALMTMK